ncbi:SDR family oxidoreductase [Limnobacter parvus]|uniref:SDR family oxidoreductase n=1 Tax=Limnobacter parvus TaxID=2939690 RepID=A0ABT1XNH6_9BURK|nr:SDR family oxidoreductase [Limnobacter parvus]MCR2747827.1 SDR family oxidoreductase [Limnobacter parvus]
MIKAIVTGHSKGLGLGIAGALLAQGHPVLGLSSSINTTLQPRFPTLLHQIAIDLSENSALEILETSPELQQFIENATLLLLINNAGRVTPIGPLETQNPHDVSRSVQLNVGTPLALSALISQQLKPVQQLRILHVSSGAGRSAYSGWAVYCATKAALDMHAQAVQQDNLSNVRICSLAPGVIDTGMQAQIRQVDEAHFPNKQRFIELHEQGLLTSAEETGARILGYLLGPKFGEIAVDDLRTY